MQACPASPPAEARAAVLPAISQTRLLAPRAMTLFSFGGAILVALVLNAVAMVLFVEARDVGELILARAVQGLCVGTGTTALGAAILDTNRARGPLLNSVTPFLGLTAGSLGTATLITFAPDPLHRVYDVLLGLTAVMIALLWMMPESISRKTGALAS